MIGIVTYQDVVNFGAYLQLYALHKALLGLGARHTILNYKGRTFWLNEYKCFFRTKSPSLLWSNLRKIHKFRAAQRKLPMTAFSSRPESFHRRSFDTILFGSDEIWNYRNPIVGRDLFYFGDGLSAKRKIAYAPSCGALNADAEFPPEMATLLRQFDRVSVRDENSRKILEKIVGADVPVTLDPTFLYDFSGEERSCPHRDFIMLYTTGVDPTTSRRIRDYADKRRKPLISVGYPSPFCDASIVGIDPFEFLGYLRNADEVITTMFHGSVLALQYRKNLCVLMDPYRANKLSALLQKWRMSDRVVGEERDIESVLRNPIDYDAFNRTLDRERAFSLGWLGDALAGTNASDPQRGIPRGQTVEPLSGGSSS